jgi:uncharacterized protein YnzC (UPF0291/DUF896 family)
VALAKDEKGEADKLLKEFLEHVKAKVAAQLKENVHYTAAPLVHNPLETFSF